MSTKKTKVTAVTTHPKGKAYTVSVVHDREVWIVTLTPSRFDSTTYDAFVNSPSGEIECVTIQNPNREKLTPTQYALLAIETLIGLRLAPDATSLDLKLDERTPDANSPGGVS